MTDTADLIIAGGGIVGLATAYRFMQRCPGRRAVVLEKERSIASHQTGRNSGVIHSGIYYKPGSRKAVNCRRGKAMLEAFCTREGIAWERCGKVIVATSEAEMARLPGLIERGLANGVACRALSAEELREREPHVAGIGAILVEETGIVDYPGVCARLATLIAEAGGEVRTGTRVLRFHGGEGDIVAETTGGDVRARAAVNAAGLHCDRLAAASGAEPVTRIVPFRGEYHELVPARRFLVKHLIYPVPNPALPFLGVHFTRMIAADADGPRIECGPNAVFALAREGYTKLSVSPRDTLATLADPRTWRLFARYWQTGLHESVRSWSRAMLVRSLRRLVPEVNAADLISVPAGVRAQAVDAAGRLVDDFVIERRGAMVHVLNAPSPAATSALSIGDDIAALIEGDNPGTMGSRTRQREEHPS